MSAFEIVCLVVYIMFAGGVSVAYELDRKNYAKPIGATHAYIFGFLFAPAFFAVMVMGASQIVLNERLERVRNAKKSIDFSALD